jgi:hypothetical protein
MRYPVLLETINTDRALFLTMSKAATQISNAVLSGIARRQIFSRGILSSFIGG